MRFTHVQGVELLLPTDFVQAPCDSKSTSPGTRPPSASTGDHSFSGNVDVIPVSPDPFDSSIATLDIDDDAATAHSPTAPAAASGDSAKAPGKTADGVPPVAASTDRCSVVRVAGSGSGIPEGSAAADIGPATRDAYAAALHGCKTILWTGPLGACEGSSFAGGTLAIAQAIAAQTAAGAVSIVGGAARCPGLH